jgi:hypothetical protein
MTTSPSSDAPVVDLYSAEFGDSLTGFEEKFIAEAFGDSIDGLGTAGMIGVRALVFAHRMREGDKSRAAKDYALGLTRGKVASYFLGLGNRPDGDTPATEGKG